MKTIVYNVKGMMCGGCESRVTKAVLALSGANGCHADHKEEKVEVIYDESLLDARKIQETIEDCGYDVM